MENVQMFNFNGSQVRALIIDGDPYFVGKDVAEILGYVKPRNAITMHVDNEDKTTALIQGTGSNYKSKAIIINESGLYSLILSSKLPQAKQFKHWVTSEVLPSIHKYGAYATPQTIENIIDNPDFGIKLLQSLKSEQDKNKKLESQNKDMKPKALFADAVETSDTSILVGQLAKLLKQNGVDIGQNKLFKYLRDNHYLGKRGEYYNMPTQYSMEIGLFEIKERTIQNPDGSVKTVRTTKVTGKGQTYFVNKFLK